MEPIKIVVLGNIAVGKSALVVRLSSGLYYTVVEKYDPTIEDSFRKQEIIEGEKVCLEVLDTSGGEITQMRALYITHAAGFLLVYSVTDRSSFEAITHFRDNILQVRQNQNPHTPSIILANKNDIKEQRQVFVQEGPALAKRLGALFMETSAKTGENVRESFHTLTKEIWRLNGYILKPKKKCIIL